MKTKNVKTKNLHEVNSYLRSEANGNPLVLTEASHLHGLGAGLKHGEVIIEGDAGDYLGVLNDGATLRVKQNSGSYLADNMTAGTVIVEGNVGYGAGQYCYGGNVIIRGNAGDFTATMNKGAVIIVGGDVGDEVGTYMLKGDLIVIGNTGDNFANYLIRGSVYLGGKYHSLGHNTKVIPMTGEDKTKLRTYFEKYSLTADPDQFIKIVAASEKPFYH
jgi:glutamate synthase domain-containing protein 3